MLNAAQPVVGTLTNDSCATTATPFDDIAQVHALYEERIFRFLLFSVRDRDIALSLTQDTFLKAWRTRASFRGDCAVPTWLMRIAVSLLRSHTRTETFQFWKKASATAVDVSAVELRSEASSAEGRLVTRERLKAVWDAVEKLPAQQRTVFLLRFVEEMDLAEIVEATGVKLPTVKSHLYRALDNVRAAQGVAAGPSATKGAL